ncbi:MAG: histidinol phosphate phosphatase domain-containing protein [Deltaproteobacteria bacterium]|nr:histidinol phosphate phosphatase domain-containing protein [Deltaproteobacteria bacterium]MCL5791733.1 histidinol phosphate phosphatase domain-containing protein [Deltaproteobacteria bacterium]
MIDLHTHSLFSDGELLPSELVRRAEDIGIKAIAITDHVDFSNFIFVIEHIRKAAEELSDRKKTIKVLTGVEITHVPPDDIPALIELSRKHGADIIVVHGETIVEPVEHGTNLAAINGRADILAHPGFISLKEAKLAAKNHVYLEISGRHGHSFSNGYVSMIAQKAHAGLVFNTDAHAPYNLMDYDTALKIVRGAGLSENDFKNMLENSKNLIRRNGHELP